MLGFVDGCGILCVTCGLRVWALVVLGGVCRCLSFGFVERGWSWYEVSLCFSF